MHRRLIPFSQEFQFPGIKDLIELLITPDLSVEFRESPSLTRLDRLTPRGINKKSRGAFERGIACIDWSV